MIWAPSYASDPGLPRLLDAWALRDNPGELDAELAADDLAAELVQWL